MINSISFTLSEVAKKTKNCGNSIFDKEKYYEGHFLISVGLTGVSLILDSCHFTDH